MTKLVIYRNNSAYEQFLAPAIAGREGFEMQVFTQGTPETEITAWLIEHADQIRGMEKVYTDFTCYESGEDSGIWKGVAIGWLDSDFQKLAGALMTKATVEETIAEVVRHLLAKEVPTKVFVISKNMGDHDMFRSGKSFSKDYHDADRIRECLSMVTGIPSLDYSDWEDEDSNTGKDTVWVFLDRHFKHADKYWWNEIPSTWRKFELPIENLVHDAIAFGINLDAETFSQLIREKVATW